MKVKHAERSKGDPKPKRGRPPGLTHPVGVLRQIIGQTQQEFARSLGNYSHHTIEAIERGALGLSEQLAQQISQKTDISVGWLLRGDPQAPPLDTHNRPYTRETFELAQVLEHPPPGGGVTLQELLGWASAKHCRRVLGIVASAAQKGAGNLCDYRLTEALDNLEKRFGYDPHSASAHGLTERLLQDGSVSPAELKPAKAKSKRKKKAPR